MSTILQTSAGLEDVILTSTQISQIDGTAGCLSYAGYDIHELAEQLSFEEVCWLLWHGELPTTLELAEFRAQLAAERVLTATELRLVDTLPLSGHGMDALRTLASGLAQLDPQAEHLSEGAALRVGIRLIAKLPVLIAAWDRRRHGFTMIAPNEALGTAANFLYMLHGELPDVAAQYALNIYMVLLAEHGLNASTFAARVAISAQTDIYAATVAAIATLKGLLHGGANQKAMETFLAIGSPERAAAVIEDLLARHERLMGIGHRIYKVEDPRVRHLRDAVCTLNDRPEAIWYKVADATSQVIANHPYFVQRRLNPNVEFYSAPLLYALRIPIDLFTVAFALSRVAGWIAHIREQIADNRIIRPKAAYSGPAMRRLRVQ